MPFPTSMRALAGAAAMALLALASTPAAATFAASRTALGADDSATWAQLGADGDPVGNGAVAVTALNGLQVTIANPGGPGVLTRFNEAGGIWAGNFSAGDALLTTFDQGGAIRLSFSTGVARVGTQIQGLDYAPFSGVITAYNAASTVLETYSVLDPAATGEPNGSALYLGIARGAADIAWVDFQITSTGSPVFGINQLDVSQRAVSPPVPEPSALVLAAFGLAGLALHRRLRTAR